MKSWFGIDRGNYMAEISKERDSLRMVEMNCPECGHELEAGETLCRNCGYKCKDKHRSGAKQKTRIIQYISAAIECLCLILAFSRVYNDNYAFYKQHYADCMAEYEECIAAAEDGIYFRDSYRSLARSFKEMADSDLKEVWKYRIQGFCFMGTGAAVWVVGNKLARRKED